ncbi:MAG TPA: pitrilysin family protein [Pyrinomonadaceae bacterium]|nr:pitrilysin family protein [Pyrinomonadaceae bacterium]
MKEDIKETRLENGLTILTDRMDGVRSATLGFFYRVGSRNEPVDLNGITHFIEHAVFKGTSKRSALEIAIEQDRLGGNLEAFTTHEETGFAIKVIDDQLESAFKLLADMMSDPVFDEKELRSEQRVIIEELKMVEDSPEEYLGELFSEAFFPNHHLGLNIAGTARSVKTFDHAKTRYYFARAFTPANLVITAAGNVDHGKIVNLAKRLLPGQGRRTKARTQKPKPAAPILIKQRKDLEQAHLIIATPFPGGRDKKRYAADMLANILGGGMSSRLWQKIREERGLAYSVGASAVMFRDCGYFTVYAGTSAHQTGEVVDISIAEMSEIVKNGVTEQELDLAKRQAIASVLLSLEDSAARATTLAQCECLHGRQIPVEETIRNIEAVTIADVRRLAREFFKTEKVAFAALGDLKGLKMPRSRLSI